MENSASRPSPQLQAANQRLHELRAQQKGASTAHCVPPWEAAPPPDPLATADIVAELPSHLGWGSAPATQAARAARKRRQEAEQQKQPLSLPQPAKSQPQPDEKPPQRPKQIKLYPDLALGMMRQEQAAAGRIWLLLRHLDRDGRGWFHIDNVKPTLTGKGSAMRVCGWRQLRNLLREGQGVFWQRDKTRIWLRSVARVATSLEVPKLTNRPVALPLKVLLSGMGAVKAHFYASFHSGRKPDQPISRDTLTEITDIPAATQRLYEKRAGIRKQHNIAIGEKYSTKNVQNRAWLHGNAVFDFIDHHGRQGPEKGHYVAWHLPNTYEGCHQPAPRGRMRKINRQIDLVNRRAQGTDLSRLFHPDGGAAGKAYNRNGGQYDAYWECGNGRGRESLWYVLPQLKDKPVLN